jgi:hypothetical protein
MSPGSAEVRCCTMSSWPRVFECKMIGDSEFKPCIKAGRCIPALCFTFTSQSLSCYFGTLPQRNSPPFADYFDRPAQFTHRSDFSSDGIMSTQSVVSSSKRTSEDVEKQQSPAMESTPAPAEPQMEKKIKPGEQVGLSLTQFWICLCG